MKKEMMKKLLLAVVLSTLTIALSGCTGDKSGEENSSNSGAAVAETASASSISTYRKQNIWDRSCNREVNTQRTLACCASCYIEC